MFEVDEQSNKFCHHKMVQGHNFTNNSYFDTAKNNHDQSDEKKPTIEIKLFPESKFDQQKNIMKVSLPKSSMNSDSSNENRLEISTELLSPMIKLDKHKSH